MCKSLIIALLILMSASIIITADTTNSQNAKSQMPQSHDSTSNQPTNGKVLVSIDTATINKINALKKDSDYFDYKTLISLILGAALAFFSSWYFEKRSNDANEKSSKNKYLLILESLHVEMVHNYDLIRKVVDDMRGNHAIPTYSLSSTNYNTVLSDFLSLCQNGDLRTAVYSMYFEISHMQDRLDAVRIQRNELRNMQGVGRAPIGLKQIALGSAMQGTSGLFEKNISDFCDAINLLQNEYNEIAVKAKFLPLTYVASAQSPEEQDEETDTPSAPENAPGNSDISSGNPKYEKGTIKPPQDSNTFESKSSAD